MKTKILLTLGAGLLSATALAGPDQSPNAGRTQISLSDLRDHCTAIVGNPQMKPQTVDIDCSRTQTVWRECGGSFGLGSSGNGSARIGLKDWFALAQRDDAPGLDQHPCSTFEQHRLTISNVMDHMGCDQLLSQFKTDDDLNNYCAGLVAKRLGLDPSVQQDTVLATFSTCNSQYGIQQKGPDQSQCAPAAPKPPVQQGQNNGGQNNGGQNQGGQNQGGQAGQAPGQGGQAQQQGGQSGQAPGQGHQLSDSSSDSHNF